MYALWLNKDKPRRSNFCETATLACSSKLKNLLPLGSGSLWLKIKSRSNYECIIIK